jgi:hypothetical protein
MAEIQIEGLCSRECPSGFSPDCPRVPSTSECRLLLDARARHAEALLFPSFPYHGDKVADRDEGAKGDGMRKNQEAPTEQRPKESFQREKHTFAWACIWLGLAVIALAGFFFVEYWVKRQVSAILLGPPDERGRVVALLKSSERWKAAFLFPWLFFTLAFALSMGSWLLAIRHRRALHAAGIASLDR